MASKGSKTQDIRGFTNGQFKDGCTFSIQLKSRINEKKMPDSPISKSRPKHRNEFSDGNLVTVVTVTCEHGG